MSTLAVDATKSFSHEHKENAEAAGSAAIVGAASGAERKVQHDKQVDAKHNEEYMKVLNDFIYKKFDHNPLPVPGFMNLNPKTRFFLQYPLLFKLFVKSTFSFKLNCAFGDFESIRASGDHILRFVEDSCRGLNKSSQFSRDFPEELRPAAIERYHQELIGKAPEEADKIIMFLNKNASSPHSKEDLLSFKQGFISHVKDRKDTLYDFALQYLPYPTIVFKPAKMKLALPSKIIKGFLAILQLEHVVLVKFLQDSTATFSVDELMSIKGFCNIKPTAITEYFKQLKKFDTSFIETRKRDVEQEIAVLENSLQEAIILENDLFPEIAEAQAKRKSNQDKTGAMTSISAGAPVVTGFQDKIVQSKSLTAQNAPKDKSQSALETKLNGESVNVLKNVILDDLRKAEQIVMACATVLNGKDNTLSKDEDVLALFKKIALIANGLNEQTRQSSSKPG